MHKHDKNYLICGFGQTFYTLNIQGGSSAVISDAALQRASYGPTTAVSVPFVWGQPTPKGNLWDAQLIVVQATSACEGGIPGKTNIELANLAEKYHKSLEIPIFPQAEVGEILEARDIPLVGTTPFYGTLGPLSPEYIKFGSHGIARLQQDLCIAHGWTKVLVDAPYPHAWRVIWIYEKLGLEVVIPQNLPKMKFQRDFCCRRWQMALTAYPYEFLARLYFLYKGLI